MGYRWRWRWRGRPPIIPRISLQIDKDIYFIPSTTPPAENCCIEIYPDELEALKLVYIDNLTTDEASSIFGVSKTTFWRILESGRRKVVEALVNLRPLKIVALQQKSIEQ